MRTVSARDVRWTTRVGPVELESRLLTTAMVRTPGFPLRLVDGMSSPELLDVVDRLADIEAAVERERASFHNRHWHALRAAVDTLPGRGALPVLYRVHKAVSRRSRVEHDGERLLGELSERDWVRGWNALVGRREELDASMRRLFGEALARGAEHVVAACRDDQVRHAVFVSNPRFYRQALTTALATHTGPLVVEGELVTAVRRVLLTMHRYLRRFATRCESVSFYGPATFARLDEEEPLAVQAGPPRQETSFVEASAWLTDELLARLTDRIPLPDRYAWRGPLFAETPAGLRHVLTGKRYRIGGRPLSLWRSADGSHTLGELAAAAGIDGAELPALVRALGPTLVVSAVAVPATEPRPTSLLAAAVGADTAAARLAGMLAAFAEATWPERVRRYEAMERVVGELGISLRRNAGQYDADRELLHEDRSGPLSERVTFGRPVVAAARSAVDAVLSVSYLGALLRREDAREALREATGGRGGSFAELATREVTESEPRWERLRSRLARLVRTVPAGDTGVVELTSAEVGEATADLWELVDPRDRADPCLPSADFMIAGADPETGRWVLSELHGDCGSVFGGVETQVHSAPAALFDEFTEAVRDLIGERAMATVISRRRNARITPELPGLSLELSGRSGRSRDLTRPIAEVALAPDARAVLVDGVPTQLYPDDLSSALRRAVSLPSIGPVPIEVGRHTPRIIIDGLVYQRARWRITLSPPRAGSSFDRWRELVALRTGHRLPRRVYVRHPLQPKPLYVDFADPIALLDLARLPPGEVVMTEMLPAPEQLWWGSAPERQCAELRLGVLIKANNGGGG